MKAINIYLTRIFSYGGTPIECWVNPHSRESMEEYIESYCWIQNTYFIPMFENIPDDHQTRESEFYNSTDYIKIWHFRTTNWILSGLISRLF
jgi:hypothetical protein